MVDKTATDLSTHQGQQMTVGELIRKKRDGNEISEDEVKFYISQLINGNIADSQIGAMLMAMYIRGVSDSEAGYLTQAMVSSGEQLEWAAEWGELLVDKHSTGGVGDKVSIVLAPVLAACGLKVPMVSGRSLEHTGGTLDKLESIPGFTVDLDLETMRKALEHTGCFITAATKQLCPADRILYRIRDITCTVDCVNLIVPSIISKKVASGTKFLVVDVKVGKGAFCKNVEMARGLAKQLISVSARLGVRTRVVLTRMDEPLGLSAGNALEVAEAVECLKGNMAPDVERIVDVLGSNLLEMTGRCHGNEASQLISRVLRDGSALERFRRMLSAQGVDEETSHRVLRGESVLPESVYTTQLKAHSDGWVCGVDAWTVGQVCLQLGAGRRGECSQHVDPAVGVRLTKQVGDAVAQGEVWMTVHHSTPSLPRQTVDSLHKALTIQAEKVDKPEVILEVIQ